ncbi:MAG: nitrous oxide reductase accessory protein NosL [Rhodoferax sp.]
MTTLAFRPLASAKVRQFLLVLAVGLVALVWGGARLALWNGWLGQPNQVPVTGDVCIVAPPTPYDPSLGLPLLAARPIPADARCPVCGMYPARASDWAAQVIFENGDAQFFDSPLSLFMYVQNVERYSPGRSVAQIRARYVTDGSSKRWIAAETAWYVHGSNALGPMRAGNLPAFSSQEDALQFTRQRGGHVLKFTDVGRDLIEPLAGRARHADHAGRAASATKQ